MPAQPLKNVNDHALAMAIARAEADERVARREWQKTASWLEELKTERGKRNH